VFCLEELRMIIVPR